MEPHRMAGRGEHVVTTLPEQHGSGYVGEFYRPRVGKRDDVVYPAVHRLAQRLGVGLRNDPTERDIPHDIPIRADEFWAKRIDQALRIVSNSLGLLDERGDQRLQMVLG